MSLWIPYLNAATKNIEKKIQNLYYRDQQTDNNFYSRNSACFVFAISEARGFLIRLHNGS